MASDESVMRTARSMCKEDYTAELTNVGLLRPTKNADPLDPPWTLTEYEAMERDSAKYFLYYAAIAKAVKSLEAGKSIECMVVGAGCGRLVDYCLDCLTEHVSDFALHVIEVNESANALLHERFKSNRSVLVHAPLVVRSSEEIERAIDLGWLAHSLCSLHRRKSIDMFVSELFGSFADNEFVSEILAVAVKLFGRDGCMSVPMSYETYLCAVHSPTIDCYLDGARSRECCYILGLPTDARLLTQMLPLYSNECTEAVTCLSGDIMLPLKSEISAELRLSGFAGFFRAQLFEDIYVDTRPGPEQNTYFWECAFFPASEITKDMWDSRVADTNVTAMGVCMKRCCEQLPPDNCESALLNVTRPVMKMWYEWALCHDDATMHNLNGSSHSLYI